MGIELMAKRKSRARRRPTVAELPWNGDHGPRTAAAMAGTYLEPIEDENGKNPNRMARRRRKSVVEQYEKEGYLTRDHVDVAMRLQKYMELAGRCGSAFGGVFVDGHGPDRGLSSQQVEAAAKVRRAMKRVPMQCSGAVVGVAMNKHVLGGRTSRMDENLLEISRIRAGLEAIMDGEPITLKRGEAAQKYGGEFVSMFMGDRASITLQPAEQVILHRWSLMRANRFVPFHFDYVYVIEDDQSRYKVGYTTSPKKRLGTQQISNADALELTDIIVLRAGAGRNVERAAQNMLKKQGAHIRGEWFSGDASVAALNIRDMVQANYPDRYIPLSDAWEGCEPLMPLFKVIFKNDQPEIEKCEALRSEFLWVLDQLE